MSERLERILSGDGVKLIQLGREDNIANPLEGFVLTDASNIASKITDHEVQGKDLQVWIDSIEGTAAPVDVPTVLNRKDGNYYDFTSWSFSQMADRIGMGAARFMKKNLKAGFAPLVSDCFNTWLRTCQDKDFLLRTYEGGTMEGFLSGKYGVFDHIDVVKSLNEAFSETGYSDLQLDKYLMTPTSMELRVTDPEKVIVSGHDESTAGMIIRNGQMGGGSVTITFMVYTWMCSNGMILGPDNGVVYSRRHININKSDFTREVIEAFKKFPEYVEIAREDIKLAKEFRIGIDVKEELLKKVKEEGQFSEKDMEKVVELFGDKYPTNMWGLTSTLTEIAQGKSPDRQYQIEQYAGKLLKRVS